MLAGIEGFTVTSRTSSFHFKGTDQPLPEIARELHVDYVLEGSVRKAGQQVRITAQLIKVDGDAHMWSESWTRDLADIFAVQEGIARNVATELKARLSERDEAHLTRSGTHNVEAYEQYLRGRHLWNERSLVCLRRSTARIRTDRERIRVRIDRKVHPAGNRARGSAERRGPPLLIWSYNTISGIG